MIIVLTIIAVVTVTFLLYLKWCFTYWERRRVFTFPPSIPFGNAKDFIFAKTDLSLQILPLYKEAKAKGLRYAGYYFINQPYLLVVDMDLIRSILAKDFQHFTDRGLVYVNEKADPLTGHLFSLGGAKWKALRSKLSPTFSSGKLKYMFQTLVDCTKGLPVLLDEAIRKQEPVDIKETFARYTTDVIGSCAFGIECNCLKNPNNEFRKYGKKIFENTPIKRIKRFISFVMPAFIRYFNVPLNDKDVIDFFINLVKESISLRDQAKIQRKDFLQLLMELRHKELKVETTVGVNGTAPTLDFYQSGLSINEIAAQAFVFYGAGFETSSTTLTFLMFELATQPEIQEKLRNEINEVLAKHDGKITYEAINEMTYLDKCINETLRKYPPVPLLLRTCTKTYRIPDSDIVIEKGAIILISAYGIQHDPEYYPDPEKFDPERFSEENKNKLPPMTFLPFGEGPRICIGLRFGVLQTKVGLVAMMKQFKFTFNPKTKCPLEFNPQTILSVKGDVWVDAQRI